jgi:hypothetical protein
LKIDEATAISLKKIKKKKHFKNMDETVRSLFSDGGDEGDVEEEVDESSEDENDGEKEVEEKGRKPGLHVMYEKDIYARTPKNLKYHTGLRRGAYFWFKKRLKKAVSFFLVFSFLGWSSCKMYILAAICLFWSVAYVSYRLLLSGGRRKISRKGKERL